MDNISETLSQIEQMATYINSLTNNIQDMITEFEDLHSEETIIDLNFVFDFLEKIRSML